MVRLLAALVLFSGIAVQAQSLVSYSFSPAGATFSNSGVKGIWQIGGITRGSTSNQAFTVHQEFVANSRLEVVVTDVLEDIPNLTIYPNPASEILNISGLEQSEIQNIVLISSIGHETILEPNYSDNNSISLSLTHFSAGVYVLRISRNQSTTPIIFRIKKN